MDVRRWNNTQYEKWERPELVSEHTLAPHAAFLQEETISLNGEWEFRCASSVGERQDDFWREEYAGNPQEWTRITVPGCWEVQGHGTPYYYGSGFPSAVHTEAESIPSIEHGKNVVGQYRRRFILPEKTDRRTVLRFGSVKSAFYCWLNGTYIGFAKGSMLPSEFDVTELLREGENLLCVEIYQFSDASYLENQDMWVLSGIYRDVVLVRENAIRIRDVHAWSEFETAGSGIRNGGNGAVSAAEAVLHCEAALMMRETAERAGEDGASLRLRVQLLDGEQVCAEEEREPEIRSDARTDAENGAGTAVQAGERSVTVSLICHDVLLWSAETPKVYRIRLSLMEEERPLCVREVEFGFRKVERDGERLLVNGMPLKLRGVNYHAFTPDGGYYVPRETMEEDLRTMKRYNINAIRTSHYPQDSYFYHLCNVLGLYVMDECNVESHGVREKGVPGDDPLWRGHVTDRMARMVVRDRNHPCVVIWSLGNESDCGENHYRMRETALALDGTRPVHYEGGADLKASDFVCVGYSSAEREQQFADGKDVLERGSVTETVDPNLLMSLHTIRFETYRDHPIVATEYMHCMGNSGSDMGRHMEVFEHSARWCGGFLWDYRDKALRSREGEGYARDGEFTRESHPLVFGCNGIVNPEGVPHEGMAEIRHAYQTVEAEYLGREESGACRIRLTNRNSFLNLSAFECRCRIERDGALLHERTLCVDLAPRQTAEVSVPVPAPEESGARDCFLTLSFHLRETLPWAQEGFAVAADQWRISDSAQGNDDSDGAGQGCQSDGRSNRKPAVQGIAGAQAIPFRRQENADCAAELSREQNRAGEAVYVADTPAVRFTVSAQTGDLVSLYRKDTQEELLLAPLRPAFARAKTDADLGFYGLALQKDRTPDAWMKLSAGELDYQAVPIGEEGTQGSSGAGAASQKRPGVKEDDQQRTNKERGEAAALTFCVVLQDGETRLGELTRRYTAFSDGSLWVEASFTAMEGHAPMRFGMQTEIPVRYGQMTWYGKGPQDTYQGREAGALVGIYRKEVREQDEHVRPQEHGNKTGVRWLTLTDERQGGGLRVEAVTEPVSASAWPYTLRELWEAQRAADLPAHTKTTLNIDAVQNGLGDSFVPVPQEYVMRAGETYRYGFRLSVVKSIAK
ncbi:MAG: glycoside hydrolase family 2 TIM barrel-domain containing protein [Eubacteriales bacterium]|nr:glycoside hydrolase family 2 TIM barrel-domain containing protein [Eubacteriales bacterium]